ncbi:hypothetical protein TorRG33x02_274780 [Trema orientale]|uniref:Uncharacterized protein n=1 Tax=Trema orientale TaxID=63057 RepID=A0A2P5CSA9_TREOI|nr:hypothetical protein TorRG33x02_274780 [Trema orientale]
MESIEVTAMLRDNEDLDLVVYLGFTIHVIEIDFKVAIGVVNSYNGFSHPFPLPVRPSLKPQPPTLLAALNLFHGNELLLCVRQSSKPQSSSSSSSDSSSSSSSTASSATYRNAEKQ